MSDPSSAPSTLPLEPVATGLPDSVIEAAEPERTASAAAPAAPASESSASPRRARRSWRRRRRWLSWIGVGVIGLVAVGSGLVSAELRDHADERRQLMEEITQLEVLATEHSMTIWKALTFLMAEDRMGFIKLRGQAGMQREAMAEQLDRIQALDDAGAEINGLLGFEANIELAERLRDSAQSFTAGVRGAYGQMNLSTDRLRKRLGYWDMGYGSLEETLVDVKAHHEEVAVTSARVARRVTGLASLARLLASFTLALSLSRFRRRVAAATAVTR